MNGPVNRRQLLRLIGASSIGSTVLSFASQRGQSQSSSQPDAEFTYSPEEPETGEGVRFDATASHDDGSIEEYYWEFEESGDRTDIATSSETTQYWHTRGRFYVSLEVTDDEGHTDSTFVHVVVGNDSPEARFTIEDTTPPVGEPVEFSAEDSSDPNGDNLSFTWRIADELYQGETVEHSFDSAGEKRIHLRVQDSLRATDSESTEIIVGNQPPNPSISYSDSNITAGSAVTFDARGSTDPDGTIDSYEWTLPDGTVQTGEEISYTFSDAGSKTISLTVTDDWDRSATEEVIVQIREPTSTPTQTPTATETRTPEDTQASETDFTTVEKSEEPIGGNGSDSSDNLTPIVLGALGLGGLGALLHKYSSKNSRPPQVQVDELVKDAQQALEEANEAREQGEYDRAIEAYQESIVAAERAFDALDPESEIADQENLSTVLTAAHEGLEETQRTR